VNVLEVKGSAGILLRLLWDLQSAYLDVAVEMFVGSVALLD